MEKPKKYYRADGTPTTSDDPERLLFDSMHCTFWTDDWSLLEGQIGLPGCPKCGCVGMQTEAKNWDEGVANFIKESGKSHYKDFLESTKHKCIGPVEKAWERYDARHKREADKRKPN